MEDPAHDIFVVYGEPNGEAKNFRPLEQCSISFTILLFTASRRITGCSTNQPNTGSLTAAVTPNRSPDRLNPVDGLP
ncbi:unnamed protein product [Dovyalis caffra]|uniref:Uncharacterized protein n=1 Tax=Dovyalis caffra TaxID=77055 RepID=A0AAV1SUS9_9ROSI|nr:unnamed protein product [Dovyalis caffra]